jgi:hypothetical protein
MNYSSYFSTKTPTSGCGTLSEGSANTISEKQAKKVPLEFFFKKTSKVFVDQHRKTGSTLISAEAGLQIPICGNLALQSS